MIKTFTTSTVWCDGADCDEVFADVVETSSAVIRTLAKRQGWLLGDERDLCPKCRKIEAAKILETAEV